MKAISIKCVSLGQTDRARPSSDMNHDEREEKIVGHMARVARDLAALGEVSFAVKQSPSSVEVRACRRCGRNFTAEVGVSGKVRTCCSRSCASRIQGDKFLEAVA